MSLEEQLKSPEDMERMAEQLSDFAGKEEIATGVPTVARWINWVGEGVFFPDGQEEVSVSSTSNVNIESMGKTYSVTGAVGGFFASDVVVDWDSTNIPYKPKDVPLPSNHLSMIEDVPSAKDRTAYDEQIRQFCSEHSGLINERRVLAGRITRVRQDIIVNSQGGLAMRTTPYFSLIYNFRLPETVKDEKGNPKHDPLEITKVIGGVCTSPEDISRLALQIKYLADPTPRKDIRNSKTWYDALLAMQSLAILQPEKIKKSELDILKPLDVVILDPTLYHEMVHFAVHRMNPYHRLEPQPFNLGDQIFSNCELNVSDDPHHRVGGMRMMGHTPFDAYGWETREVIQVVNGSFMKFLPSQYTSAGFNKYHNDPGNMEVGNSAQGPKGLFPQPRPTCTVAKGPTTQLDDLEGKVIMVAGNADDTNGNGTVKLFGRECYIIRDGKPVKMDNFDVVVDFKKPLDAYLLDEYVHNLNVCTNPCVLQSKGLREGGYCPLQYTSQVGPVIVLKNQRIELKSPQNPS